MTITTDARGSPAAAVQAVRFCGRCGEESLPTEQFCVACGTRLRAAGEAPPATADLAAAADATPDDSAALRHAVGRLAEGDAKTAIHVLERLCAEQPGWAIAHAYLGAAYLRLTRVADARDALERAVALAPESFICHYRYGEYLARLGFYDQALREFDLALARPAPDALTARAAADLREFCKTRMKGLYYRDLAPHRVNLRNFLPGGHRRATTERVS
jgi:tetratricopeptide (TPR) repeat protein